MPSPTIEMAMSCYNLVYFSAVVLLLLAAVVRRKLTFWSRQQVPSRLTVLHETFRKPISVVDKDNFTRIGKIFGTYEILTPVLMVAEPKTIGKILVTGFKYFADHRKFMIDGQMLATNILTSDYKIWKNQRLILTSTAFGPTTLTNLKSVIDRAVDKLLKHLMIFATTERDVNVLQFYERFTLNVIINGSLGVDMDSLEVDPNKKVIENVTRMHDLKFTVKSLTPFFFKNLAKLFNVYFFDYKSLKYLYDFVGKIIEKKKSEKSVHCDLVNLMLDNEKNCKQKLTPTEIKDNALIFVMTGFNKLQAALSTITFLLATHPSVQTRLFDEINQLFSSRPEDQLTWPDVDSLPYLDAVISESLRLMPTRSRIERRVSDDTVVTDTPFGDLFLPRNAFVTISTATVHRDPDYWPDPERFNPERFMPERRHLIQPNAYFPFGLGPRNCIGQHLAMMEIKLCLFNVVRKFVFEPTLSTKIPLTFKKEIIPVSVPTDVILRIRKRGARPID